MAMDITILQEFVSLVETGSFQETALDMNISQSSLTKHIHKLEEELNVSLFDRSSRTFKLNEFSTAYYPFAKHIVQLHQDAMVALNDLTQKDKNQFTIAYDPILGQYGLVDIITDFSKKYPEHHMHTIETYQPMELLRQRKCDFAFLSENELLEEGFSKIIYKSDHLAVVLPDDHPLADHDRLSLEQLYNEKFILHGSATSRAHEETQKFLDLCASRDFSPNVVAESQFTSTMLRYVAAGRGIAILNRLHIPKDVPNIKIIDIYPTVRSYIYMLYAKKITASSATDFLHFMIEEISKV